MKSKIWKQFTKYVLPVLALVIAVPLAAACIGTEGKTRVLADAPALGLGTNTVTFVPGGIVEYTFTPPETGYYTFWSEGDYDPNITLSGEEFSADDEDGGDGWNFMLCIELNEGETYQIEFGSWDFPEEEIDIVVNVKKGLDCTSGECGENVSWSFDEESSILSIRGDGEMNDFDGKIVPWETFKQNIKSVEIDDGITHIGKAAFISCEGLTEIVIPGHVTSIGDSAFEGCESITRLTIYNGVIDVGASAFKNCIGITEVVIPESVTSIGESAFYNCWNIKRLTIGNGVTVLGAAAFKYCAGLTEVVIPESVTSIGESAFYDCSSLTRIVISENVTSIGSDAFYGCTKVSDISCCADPTLLSWSDGSCNDFSKGADRKTICHVFSDYLQIYKDKFDNEVNVEFKGDLSHDIDSGLGSMLYGYSLSLEGDIGVKFYMDLTGVDLNANPYMEFTIPNGSKTETQMVTLAQADTVTVGAMTYYAFKCNVSAKDAFSTIKAQLVAGEKKGEIYFFSVKSYAEFIIVHASEDEQYEKSAPLVANLLRYCACAQKYFGTDPRTLDASYIQDWVLNDMTSIPDPDPHVLIGGDFSEGVTFEGATLSLKTETTLSLYFTSDIDLVFSCSGGKTVEKAKVGGYQVARIRGIKATELGTKYTLTVCQKTDGLDVILGSINYSALNYCSNVVNGDYDTDLKNVAKSLYLYYEAAKRYVASST